MDKGFLHLHVTIVSIFVFLYFIKVYLLLTDKPNALGELRRRTKIADMILGSLIILSGLYLLIKIPVIETFLIIKIVLVLVSIPIGIAAMKRASKLLAVAVLLIYVYVFAVARTNSLTLKKEAFVTPASISTTIPGDKDLIDEGSLIFAAKCVQCHGTDGKLMLNGSKDLSASRLTKTETIGIIKSGKGVMPGFADEFNNQQLNALADYAARLRKK